MQRGRVRAYWRSDSTSGGSESVPLSSQRRGYRGCYICPGDRRCTLNTFPLGIERRPVSRNERSDHRGESPLSGRERESGFLLGTLSILSLLVLLFVLLVLL